MVVEKSFINGMLSWLDGTLYNSVIVKISNYESVGRAFESLQAHHKKKGLRQLLKSFFYT